MSSGLNVRHSGESRNPVLTTVLDSRFRGNDIRVEYKEDGPSVSLLRHSTFVLYPFALTLSPEFP